MYLSHLSTKLGISPIPGKYSCFLCQNFSEEKIEARYGCRVGAIRGSQIQKRHFLPMASKRDTSVTVPDAVPVCRATYIPFLYLGKDHSEPEYFYQPELCVGIVEE